MSISSGAKTLALICTLSWVAVSCAVDDVIININPSGDSITFLVPWDSIDERVDTIIIDGDTIILYVIDTVIAPVDTILIPILDTLVQIDTVVVTIIDTQTVSDTVFQSVLEPTVDSVSGDTTFVLITDTIIDFIEVITFVTDTAFVTDTVVETIVDTVVRFDTVIETSTDTVIQLDTIVLVDTVITPPPTLDFGAESITLEVGEAVVLQVSLTNALGLPVPQTEVEWFSGNPVVASVAQGGTVSGLSTGSAQVFAIAASAGLSSFLLVLVEDNSPPAPPPDGNPTPWFEEVWDYSSTAEMQGDPNGWLEKNGDFVTLTTGLSTPWGGTTAMRDSIVPGELLTSGEPIVGGYDLEFPRAATDQPREIWGEVYVRFSANWKTNWGGSGNPDHKTLLVQNQNSSHRWSLKIGNRQGNGYACYTAADGAHGPDLIGANLDAPSQAWDGDWHRMRFHMKMGTQGGLDGRLACWFENTKYRDGDVGTNSTSSEYFEEIQLGRTLNQAPTETIWLEYGRVRFFIIDPGWD